jgi:DNA-directed RNA polymerase subunit RPC12/RpoP
MRIEIPRSVGEPQSAYSPQMKSGGKIGPRLVFMAETSETGRGIHSWDPSTNDLEQLTSDETFGRNHTFKGTLGLYGPPIIHKKPGDGQTHIEEKLLVLFSDGSTRDLSGSGLDLSRFDKRLQRSDGMNDHESQEGPVFYDQNTGRFLFTVSGTRGGQHFNELIVASGGISSRLSVPHAEDTYLIMGYSPSGKIMLYSLDYDSYLLDPLTLEITLDTEIVKPSRGIANCEPSGQCFEPNGRFVYGTKVQSINWEAKYFVVRIDMLNGSFDYISQGYRDVIRGPSVSPDGLSVACSLDTGEEPIEDRLRWQLHLMERDGSNPRRITSSMNADTPFWSYDHAVDPGEKQRAAHLASPPGPQGQDVLLTTGLKHNRVPCPNCGHRVPRGAIKCSKCKKPLTPITQSMKAEYVPVCPKCQSQNVYGISKVFKAINGGIAGMIGFQHVDSYCCRNCGHSW